MRIRNKKFTSIWNQKKIPVIFRSDKKQRFKIKLPASPDNFEWLKDKRRNHPIWMRNDECWQIPAAWIDAVAKRMLKRYGKLYVVHTYRSLQKCAPACWDALGIICECSCGGANHGMGQPEGNWHIVSDTFAFMRGRVQYSCRLILPAKK